MNDTRRIVAILGAESTGKTTLTLDLAARLEAEGRRCIVVPETLREFCDREGRTPRIDEQVGIARAQSRRIEEAAAAGSGTIVIADTTALQIAVYSDKVFGDRSLYPEAEAWQARATLTLLTALDLPWQADGLQRDGPQVREPVDALLRAALQRAGVAYAVIGGQGEARAAHAFAAVQRSLGMAPAEALADAAGDAQRWQWVCERCGDIDCERHLLPRV